MAGAAKKGAPHYIYGTFPGAESGGEEKDSGGEEVGMWGDPFKLFDWLNRFLGEKIPVIPDMLWDDFARINGAVQLDIPVVYEDISIGLAPAYMNGALSWIPEYLAKAAAPFEALYIASKAKKQIVGPSKELKEFFEKMNEDEQKKQIYDMFELAGVIDGLTGSYNTDLMQLLDGESRIHYMSGVLHSNSNKSDYVKAAAREFATYRSGTAST